MSPLARLVAEGLAALGAAIQALLGAYLLVRHGLADAPASWPAPLTRAAEGLLWPLARPVGLAPGALDPVGVALAMALYLALTCALLGALNLLARPRRDA